MIIFADFLDETTKLFFKLSALMGAAFADVKQKEATIRENMVKVESANGSPINTVDA